MGDLNGRRGRIAGMDTRGAHDRDQRAGADVRDAHLRAASDVGDRRPRLLSHGVLALRRGAAHLQTKIIAAAKAERGQEVAEEA